MVSSIACSLDNVVTLSPAKVKSILDSAEEVDYLLLDVRQPEEYQEGHIPGAKLLPLGELDQRYRELDTTRKIITYCRSGRRSLGASVLLCGLGFEFIFNMEGGILNWPYDTITGSPDEGLEMLNNIVEPKEALLLAFILENGSLDFYTTINEKLGDKAPIITRLIDMEKEHIGWIRSRLSDYSTSIDHDAEEFHRRVNRDYTEAGITVNEALLRFDSVFRDDLEAIEAAIEMECKAYDLYKRLSFATDDNELRRLFQTLSTGEKGHIQELTEELNHLLIERR
ncbi:MAG: rhodanese-like domain-containing protein [Chloroflexota bacterium]|nr:rhodanese-like domain-containing protein [Chloroflexota bacterium]